MLAAVLRVPAEHWAAHPEQRAGLERTTAAVDEPEAELQADIDAFRSAQRWAGARARQLRSCRTQLLSTFNPTGQDTPVPPNPQ